MDISDTREIQNLFSKIRALIDSDDEGMVGTRAELNMRLYMLFNVLFCNYREAMAGMISGTMLGYYLVSTHGTDPINGVLSHGPF